jgi:hypothetical protein
MKEVINDGLLDDVLGLEKLINANIFVPEKENNLNGNLENVVFDLGGLGLAVLQLDDLLELLDQGDGIRACLILNKRLKLCKRNTFCFS